MPGYPKQPCPAITLAAELRISLPAHQQNMRGAGNRLSIIDNRRSAIQPNDSRGREA